MIGFLKSQSAKCLFFRDYARKIKVNRIEYLIVSDASRYSIVYFYRLLSSSTYRYIVKPFFVISRKTLNDISACHLVKIILIDISIFPSYGKPFCITKGLVTNNS